MATMPERLAVLETQVDALDKKTDDIAADVKTLLRYFNEQRAVAETVSSVTARSEQRGRDRRDIVFRTIPLVFSTVAVLVSILAFVLDAVQNHI